MKIYLDISFNKNGTPRIYKLTGRMPTRKTKLYTSAEIETVVTFLNSFANKFAVALPCRTPEFKNYKITKLPSSFTRKSTKNG